jgi:hypothetical protein
MVKVEGAKRGLGFGGRYWNDAFQPLLFLKAYSNDETVMKG